MNNKRIFCFWEPPERMPGYLKACMKTWRLAFPDFEIVCLNFSTVGNWLSKEDLDVEWVISHYGLAQKADAFRIALLRKYGGIWLDVDTVFVSKKARDLLGSVPKLTMFGNHIACLAAPQGDAFVEHWYRLNRRRIEWHKWYQRTAPRYAQIWQRIKRSNRFGPGQGFFMRWDYFGNAPLKVVVKHNPNCRVMLDRVALKALPEVAVFPQLDGKAAYESLYYDRQFGDRLIQEANQGCGIVILHNGWTPKWVKKMTEDEFMSSGLPLAKLIGTILRR